MHSKSTFRFLNVVAQSQLKLDQVQNIVRSYKLKNIVHNIKNPKRHGCTETDFRVLEEPFDVDSKAFEKELGMVYAMHNSIFFQMFMSSFQPNNQLIFILI